MKPAFVTVEYRMSSDDSAAIEEWARYVDSVVDMDQPGVEQGLIELTARLHEAKLDESVRLRVQPTSFIAIETIGEQVDACLSDQHLGWPMALDQIELRELKRKVVLQERKLDRILALLEGGAAPAPAPAPLKPRVRAIGADGQRVDLELGDAEAAMAAAVVPAPAPRAPRPRAAPEDELPFEVDDREAPPAYINQQGPLVPIVTRDGTYTESIGASARANVQSKGFGIGGPSAKSSFQKVGDDGKIASMPLPRVGETLKHHNTSDDYQG